MLLVDTQTLADTTLSQILSTIDYVMSGRSAALSQSYSADESSENNYSCFL